MSENNTSKQNVYEQSIFIRANATTVERCFSEQQLMHQWLNPALECVPVGDWSTEIGSKFNFRLKVPVLAPSLPSTVIERRPGLVVWGFDGFFVGRDRWEALPETGTQGNAQGTTLLNRFEFTIPNPLISFGFNQFAAKWTKRDMESQLQRLKQIAERGL